MQLLNEITCCLSADWWVTKYKKGKLETEGTASAKALKQEISSYVCRTESSRVGVIVSNWKCHENGFEKHLGIDHIGLVKHYKRFVFYC